MSGSKLGGRYMMGTRTSHRELSARTGYVATYRVDLFGISALQATTASAGDCLLRLKLSISLVRHSESKLKFRQVAKGTPPVESSKEISSPAASSNCWKSRRSRRSNLGNSPSVSSVTWCCNISIRCRSRRAFRVSSRAAKRTAAERAGARSTAGLSPLLLVGPYSFRTARASAQMISQFVSLARGSESSVLSNSGWKPESR